MRIGVLTLELQLPGCTSLKEKRSRLKPLLSRLHREFNISAAEVDRQDAWQAAVIACAIVSNDAAHCQRVLQQVVQWLENDWPDVEVVDQKIEII
jgi:uncharacterized protein